MDQVENIADQYIVKLQDPIRCRHNNILFENDHIKLFLKNDTMPKCQFLLAYFYRVNDEDDKSILYAKKAIDNKFDFAYNVLGCHTEDLKEKIECFLKSAAVGYNNSFRNLGYYYHTQGDIYKSIEYYKLGIEKGNICCETDYIRIHCKNDNNYTDLLLSCAMSGCESALGLIYMKYSVEERHELNKKMLKYNFSTYIVHLLDYYEKKNKYKFFGMLEKYKVSTDGHILFAIAKKYFSIKQYDISTNLFIQSMKYGNHSAYSFLKKYTDGFVSDPKDLNIMTDFLEVRRIDDSDKAVLALVYAELHRIDDAEIMLTTIIDPYSRAMAIYKHYASQNNWREAMEALMEYMNINKDTYMDFELGLIHTNLNDNVNALKYYKIGAGRSCYECMISLAELASKQKNYMEACQYLIKSKYSNSRRWANACGILIHDCDSVEIAENLLNENISMAIMMLLRNSDNIKEKCDTYLVENECGICYTTTFCFKFLCGHGMCIECLKNSISDNCPFCKKTIDGFLIQEKV